MKTFKQYINENRLGTAAAAFALTGSALAAPPKPEALQRATEFIKSKEGFVGTATADEIATDKPLMIGYGTTGKYPSGKPIKAGETITPEKATEHLSASISQMTPHMEKIPGWDEMDAGKQAALLSFGYNLGPAFYGKKGFETISKHLETKDWEKVPEAMNLYVKSGGKVRGGLVTRRGEEGAMWRGENGSKPSPTPTPETPKPESASEHLIASGENLTRISKKYGMSIQDIMKLNPSIKDPNSIQAGQKLRIK